MYVVKKAKFRRWPVTVTLQECGADGEVSEARYSFVAHWKPFSEKELKAIFARLDLDHPLPAAPADEHSVPTGPAPMPENDQLLARAAALFPQLICGWGDEVMDEDGVAVPYSADALAKMITGADGLFVAGALNTALWQIRFGEAPRKNLSASPAPGLALVAADGAAAQMNSMTT